ncbi:MAG: hypothetical protein KDD15_21200, partial [Lewinella sp.]|nr:hypothetical protein [Lewinella sp.]
MKCTTQTGQYRLLPFVLFVLGFIVNLPSVQAQKIEKLEQVANGKADSPLPIVNWVTGNVNEQKAHFTECMSIPYHLEVLDLTPGETYCVTIGYDTKRGGKHAIDFIHAWDADIIDAHFNTFGHVHDPSVSPEMIDPLANTALVGMALPEVKATLPAPQFPLAGTTDPINHYNDKVVTPGLNYISIWNGTFVGAPCIAFESDLDDATGEGGIKVCFTVDNNPNSDAVVLAWAGHIAASAVWGPDESATSITGSPYHTFVAACNNDSYSNTENVVCGANQPAMVTQLLSGCGSKDVQLQASAVVPAAECFILGANPICGNDEQFYTAQLAAGIGTIVAVDWEITETGGDKANFTTTGNNNATDNAAPWTIGVTGVNGGDFTLTATITYCPDGEVCNGMGKLKESICMLPLMVTDPPDVSVDDDFALCEDDEPVTLTGSPTPTGGGDLGAFMFVGPGSGLTNNGDGTAEFDPEIAGPGTYTIVYQYTTAEGCSGEDEVIITVNELPDISIDGPTEACYGDGTVVFTGLVDGASAGSGTFTLTPPSPGGFADQGDGTAELSPSLVTPGTWTVTFSYEDQNGCVNSTSIDFVIHPLPIVSFSGPESYCEEDEPGEYTGLISGAYVDPIGTFTIDPPAGGFTDNGDNTATLDPGMVGDGSYVITFTYTDEFGCYGEFTQDVEIYPTPMLGIGTADIPCEDETLTFTGLVNGADATGGTFSIDPAPIGTFVDTGTGSAVFTPDINDVGTFEITFAFEDANGCGDEVTRTVDLEQCCEFFASCNLDDAVQMMEYCSYEEFLTANPFLTNINEVFSMVTERPCGTLLMYATDDPSGDLCPDGISVVRTYVLFDDLNENDELDDGEMYVECVENYLIEDNTAPEITCPVGILGLPCDFPLGSAFTTVTGFVAGGGTAFDNCSDPEDMELVVEEISGGDICNGRTLKRIYTLIDECGNRSESCEQHFSFLPPIEATPEVPPFPAQLTCAQAAAYVAPTIPYGNGQDGDCGISGTLLPNIVKDFDRCLGGTITVSYLAIDKCGREVSVGPIDIDVLPAPFPEIGDPDLPESLSCAEAVAFDNAAAGLILYSNGETGVCEISGSLLPIIGKSFDECGGVVQVAYAGVICGNAINTITYEIPVDAAPQAEFESLPGNTTVDCIDDVVTSDLDYDNGEEGVCEISGTVTSTLEEESFDGCVGEYTETWTFTDNCGRPIIHSRTISIQRVVSVSAEAVEEFVCTDDDAAAISYAVAGEPGIPDEYMIDADAAAEAAGFLDVDWTALPGSPLFYDLPADVEPGIYHFIFKVRDSSCPSCVAQDPFSIEVKAPDPNLACLGQANVSLQDDCQATLDWKDVLTGSFICLNEEDYEILVKDGDQSNGNIVDGCGLYEYVVTGPDGFTCWGYVLAEDKQPPVLEYCPDDVRGWSTYDYGFQEFICDDIEKLLLDGPVTYKLDKDGNLIEGSISTHQAKWLFKYVTGYAEFVDNCGDITVTVTDQVNYGYDKDCDDVVITRKFTARDACKGLLSPDICYQDIVIRKPTLEDVYCPKDAEISCEKAAKEDFKLDAHGNPHPDETGYPW